MQYITDDYKEEMHLAWRGKSSINAQIGLINSDAQNNASITSSFSGSETHLYDNTAMGVVTSTEADGSITFSFGDYHELNIAGLTIIFNAVPSSITVTNGTKTETYQVNDKNYVFDDGYTDCSYLTITPDSGKLSLKSITFGIAIIFNNKQIISTSRENTVNHISNELPVKQFTLTVDNRAKMFNEDNPYGYAKYLRQKQELKYDYVRDLSDGTSVTIKGGSVLINGWSSDHTQATFTCVGNLDYATQTYNKGQFYPNGISAYDLAIQVLEDAKITKYKLDDVLKGVTINNPIPLCEHREALKMIANASRCTLMEDRDGNVVITSSEKPSYVGKVEFKGAKSYCIPSSIFNNTSNLSYADAEYDYATTDGSMRFLPEDDSYLQVGFVSDDLADNNGAFAHETSIKFSYQSEYDFKKALIYYAYVHPTSITVTSKLAGTTVDTQTIAVSEMVTEYIYDGKIDEFTITFNSAQPNQRIHCSNVSVIGSQGYTLTYRELKSMPVASAIEKVSKILVHTYITDFEKMDEGTSKSSALNVEQVLNNDGGDTLNVESITSEYGAAIAIIKAAEGEQTIKFDTPYYNYKVVGGTIKEQSAYYIVVETNGFANAEIYAQPLTVTDNIYTLVMSEEGVEKEIDNPLIGSNTMAQEVAEWLSKYFDDDVEYDLTYRGDPVLDADDLIYLQNDFVQNNEIRLVKESINTSEGMDFSCSIKARRNSYLVESKVGKAVMGNIRLGEVTI